jgi:hypothetical protein
MPAGAKGKVEVNRLAEVNRRFRRVLGSRRAIFSLFIACLVA